MKKLKTRFYRWLYNRVLLYSDQHSTIYDTQAPADYRRARRAFQSLTMRGPDWEGLEKGFASAYAVIKAATEHGRPARVAPLE